MAGARTAVEASYLDHCNGQDGLNSDKSLSLCDEAEITNRESVPCSANNLMKIGSTSAGYDAAGDLTSDGVHTYQYNAEGQMISVDNGSTATYLYDALGNRVRKVSGGYTLDSQYDIEGRQVAYGNTSPSFVTWQDFLYAGGRFMGYYGAGTRFVHPDNLGSTSQTTDYTGAEIHDELYYPFGSRWEVQLLEDERFASLQRRDSETGLDPTHFRTYNSSLGRWMTPDPAGLAAADPANPQSWNMYAYVLNNPASNNDPSGLLWQAAPDDGASVDLSSLGNVGLIPPQASENGVPGTGGRNGGSPTPKPTAAPQPNTAQTKVCTEPILSAVNNQFGTNFTPNNVVFPFQPPGGAVNLNIVGGGLPYSLFNAIHTGRYPLNWWSYIAGYGPTLHITGRTHYDPPPAVFQNLNVGDATAVLFTAHIDTAFAYNPIGFLIHLFRDVWHIGGPRNPCPRG